MSRKHETITLSVSDSEKAELEKLALFFGCTWGDRPNVSKLIKAIAKGQIALVEAGSPINFDDRQEFRKKLGELKNIVSFLESL
jgi:hypothetical protein